MTVVALERADYLLRNCSFETPCAQIDTGRRRLYASRGSVISKAAAEETRIYVPRLAQALSAVRLAGVQDNFYLGGEESHEDTNQ
jgi:hypothetical protein